MSESKVAVIKAVNEMRLRVEGVNKEKKSGMMFETVSYDGLLDHVRDISIELGLNLVPHKCTQTNCTPYDVQRWDKGANAMKLVRQNCDSYIFDFRLYHSSGEYLDVSVPSVGIDPDDKGPGKAMTYAAKGAWMQVLTLKRGKGFEVDAPQNDSPRNDSQPARQQPYQAPKYTNDPKTWPEEWQKLFADALVAAKDKAAHEAKDSFNWMAMIGVVDTALNKKGCPAPIAHHIIKGVTTHLLATLLDSGHAVETAKIAEENMDAVRRYVGDELANHIEAKIKKVGTPF